MELKDLTIGFALTGSFCTIQEAVQKVQELVELGVKVVPIVSENVAKFDTRFIKAAQLIETLEILTGHPVITNIVGAEPIGPKKLMDVLVVAPCTGNTMAKIANAITDTSVTMAVKAHLRNERPVVIALSSNDGLGANAQNIGKLMNMKNIYLVPFRQDDPIQKSKSLLANNELIQDTILAAMEGRQLQPVLLD